MQRTQIEVNELIDPLLKKMASEAFSLKIFIESGDFPYHKSYYFNKIVERTSAIMLMAGEIKAIWQLQDNLALVNIKDDSEEEIEELVSKLTDCDIN